MQKGGGLASISCLSFMDPDVLMANEQTVKTHSNRLSCDLSSAAPVTCNFLRCTEAT